MHLSATGEELDWGDDTKTDDSGIDADGVVDEVNVVDPDGERDIFASDTDGSDVDSVGSSLFDS